LLYRVMPGEVVAALVLFVIANIAYEFGTVFYNAFLPEIADEGKIGRVSGLGWGLGYFGGLLALALALVTLVQPETPWFGFSTENGENVRATNLLVAAWFVVFSLPLFLWVREDRSRISPAGRVIRDGWVQLKHTFREVGRYRLTGRFLIARLVYIVVLVSDIFFVGMYATLPFCLTISERIQY